MVPSQRVRRRVIALGAAFAAAAGTIAILATTGGCRRTAAAQAGARHATGRSGPRVEGGARTGQLRPRAQTDGLRHRRRRAVLREPMEGGQEQRRRDRARSHGHEREGARADAELGAGGRAAVARWLVAGQPGDGGAGHVGGRVPRLQHRRVEGRRLPDVGSHGGARVPAVVGERRGRADAPTRSRSRPRSRSS